MNLSPLSLLLSISGFSPVTIFSKQQLNLSFLPQFGDFFIMAFEMGFDPFNFAIAILTLLVTAVRLYHTSHSLVFSQHRGSTLASTGLRSLPSPVTARKRRIKQYRRLLHLLEDRRLQE